jgi:hypothetical protein
LINDRVRIQNRIKFELQFNGIDLTGPSGKWTQDFYANLCKIKFSDRWVQEGFKSLLEHYASQLSGLKATQTF